MSDKADRDAQLRELKELPKKLNKLGKLVRKGVRMKLNEKRESELNVLIDRVKDNIREDCSLIGPYADEDDWDSVKITARNILLHFDHLFRLSYDLDRLRNE